MARESDLLKNIRSRLASFDEDALAALANRGLVRRAQKDLNEVTPSITGERDGRLLVAVGDEVVEIPESLNSARCSCPSGSICRHILSAFLFLQSSSDASQSDKPIDSTEEILALGDDTIRKWAGIQLFRRAADKLARGMQVEVQDGSPVVWSIPALNVTCRWMPGGGLSGMVCSCHSPSACEHRVMAILHYQASKGMRDLIVTATPISASSGVPRTRKEVIASVHSVLSEIISQGISRLSAAMSDRLSTLAVSAHGVDLPRLESQLKTLEREISLFLSRDAQADSRRLLIVASRTEALCRALRHPSVDLVGEHRSVYDPVGTIEIAGMGARRWNSRTGYSGLTLYFWDLSRKTWATWTDARPLSVGGFNGSDRYHEVGPWDGCSSPALASRSLIRLTSAWRNQTGRLSGRPATRAQVLGDVEEDVRPAFIKDWLDLRRRAAVLYSEGFRRRSEQDEIVALSPVQWGKPRFDSINQELVVALYDEFGRETPLVITHTPDTASAIDVLEGLELTNALSVLGLLRLNNKRLVVEPITLYEEGRQTNLTLDSAPKIQKSLRATVGLMWEEESDEGTDPEPSMDDPYSAIGLLISSIESQLELLAESGIGAAANAGTLTDLAAKAESVGLYSVARPVSHLVQLLNCRPDVTGIPEAVLKAYYLCRVASTHALFSEI